jgi:hypothetical protein
VLSIDLGGNESDCSTILARELRSSAMFVDCEEPPGLSSVGATFVVEALPIAVVCHKRIFAGSSVTSLTP